MAETVERLSPLDDDTMHLLRVATATKREREWPAASLRRAADRLDENAGDAARELDKGPRRNSLRRGADLRLSGRIDGLRSAATDLRRWAQSCEQP